MLYLLLLVWSDFFQISFFSLLSVFLPYRCNEGYHGLRCDQFVPKTDAILSDPSKLTFRFLYPTVFVDGSATRKYILHAHEQISASISQQRNISYLSKISMQQSSQHMIPQGPKPDLKTSCWVRGLKAQLMIATSLSSRAVVLSLPILFCLYFLCFQRAVFLNFKTEYTLTLIHFLESGWISMDLSTLEWVTWH